MRRRPCARAWPTRWSIATTPASVPCTSNGTPIASKFPIPAGFPKACGWTISLLPRRASATRCLPTPSSVPASSSAPRGIDTIFYEQLRNGRPAPSYDRSNEAGVVLVLPGGEANLDFVRLLVGESRAGRDLGLDDLLILNALWRDRRLATEEAARLTQKPEIEVRATLNRLVEIGLVEPRGERKGRTWHLSAATYRRLGQPAAYVRQRGFEPLQQEQVVLQYVEKHGRITRKEAAELCQVSGPQAFRLLDQLTREGRLAREGERGRGVTYRKGTK